MNESAKVLLIEDDQSLLKIYSNKLRNNGYDVSVATTGDEGLRKAQTDIHNIVLLDLILPGTDGFEVLKELKSHEKTKDVPVVILSNLGQEADIKRGEELGAVDYLVKSDVSLMDLVDKVRKYIK